MAKHGKNYQQTVGLVDRFQACSPVEAIDLAKQASYARFDETFELHLRMGVNPRSADQQVRGVAMLPHGLGKKVRILVFAEGEAVNVAEDAGADYVGSDELISKIETGWLDFDAAVATPDVMNKVVKLGRILGRRGLMPNPKSGTIVPAADLPRVINEARKGRVEFRLDRTGIIHLPMGKASFDTQKLVENMAALIEAIIKAKPSGAKGQYIQSVSLCTTMGPGIKLDMKSTLALAA
ncbi:MAG: 50S ribosomal protein L1 [Dehalococcoidia bacterium]|nr:MAG: 50S ribosomal protein L1 [Dehalococcoidia bacterium]